MTIDFKKKFEQLQKEVRKTKKVKTDYKKISKKEEKSGNGSKVCPFMTNGTKKIFCNSECALYRGTKDKGFECPLSEMSSISWIVRQILENKNRK